MKKCSNLYCALDKNDGNLFTDDDNYCSECGNALVKKEEVRCDCGYHVGNNDKFCSGCGLPLQMDVGLMSLFEKYIYNEAKQLLADGITAPEFASRFFGPKGKLRKLWNNKNDRAEFVRTKLYKWLQSKLALLRREEAKKFLKKCGEPLFRSNH